MFKFVKLTQVILSVLAENYITIFGLPYVCNSCNMGVRDLPDMYA